MPINKNFGLSEEEIQHFINKGYVAIKDAVRKDVREQWYKEGLKRLSLVKQVPDNGIIELTSTRKVFLHDIAPRAWKAVTQLLGGESRVKVQEVSDDYNFNTRFVSDNEWLPPHQHTTGWHIDGDYFKRYLDSPEQALLCLILWSKVGPKEGGTFLACDSVAKVAQFLANQSQGLDPKPFSNLYKDCKDFVEVSGEAGDIILCHPFMIHSASSRTTLNVRLLTNPPVSLLEPMQFNRLNPADYSPVERAILNGLGVDHFDYDSTRTREQFVPWRRSREINAVV